MKNLLSFLLLISCCYVSLKELTDRDIRNNFDDVQTGMGVLLRELLAVMDVNEKLSNDLNKTTIEYQKLKDQNKKIAHTFKTVKRQVKTLKTSIMKFQDQLLTNLTQEQKKMKLELSKFVTNKYAFFAWMVYKLESQNKEQEKTITDLRIESTDHKIKTIKLEKELQVMRKKLNKCDKSIKKNNEIMMDKTQKIDALQTSVSAILHKLKNKGKLTAAIQTVTKHDRGRDMHRKKYKSTSKVLITEPPDKLLMTNKITTLKPNMKSKSPTLNISRNMSFFRNYLFTTSYKVNVSDVQPDDFRSAISKYTPNINNQTDSDDILPKLADFDTSFQNIVKTGISTDKPETLRTNAGSLDANNTSERNNPKTKDIIPKEKLGGVVVKPSLPLHEEKSIISGDLERT